MDHSAPGALKRWERVAKGLFEANSQRNRRDKKNHDRRSGFLRWHRPKPLMPPTPKSVCVCVWFFMLHLRQSNCVSMCLVWVLTRIAVFP